MELSGYLIFILIMGGGFALGFVWREKPQLVKQVGRLSSAVIFLLLFIMGVNIGLDDHTMNNLLTVGLASLGFAVATIIGSMLVLALALPFVGKNFGKKASKAEADETFAQAQQEGEALAK